MDSFTFSDEFKTKHTDVYNRMYPNGELNKFAVIREAQSLGIPIGNIKIIDMAKLIQEKLIGKKEVPKTPNVMDDDPYKIMPFNQSAVDSTQLFKVYTHLLNLKSKIDSKDGRNANMYLTTMSDYILGEVTDSMVTNYVYFKELTKWRDILDKGINNQLTNNDYDTISKESLNSERLWFL